MVRLPLELLPCLLLGVLLGFRLPWLPGQLAPFLIRWGVSGDSENWSGGDTKTGPPRGA